MGEERLTEPLWEQLSLVPGAVLETAEQAVRQAGAFIQSVRASGELGLTPKQEPNDIVTRADLGAERILIDTLREHFPTHRILAEESFPSLVEATDYEGPLWIIDPVDGTTNFAYGERHVGVSVAFSFHGKVLLGLVFAPFLDEFYVAERGRGATLNGFSIHARSRTDLQGALIATGFPYARTQLDELAFRVRSVLESCRDIRRHGAASLDLCAVASGRVDGYFETVKPWDMAAGALIAREAGAKVGTYAAASDGLPPELSGSCVLASSPGIFDELVKLLTTPLPQNALA